MNVVHVCFAWLLSWLGLRATHPTCWLKCGIFFLILQLRYAATTTSEDFSFRRAMLRPTNGSAHGRIARIRKQFRNVLRSHMLIHAIRKAQTSSGMHHNTNEAVFISRKLYRCLEFWAEFAGLYIMVGIFFFLLLLVAVQKHKYNYTDGWNVPIQVGVCAVYECDCNIIIVAFSISRIFIYFSYILFISSSHSIEYRRWIHWYFFQFC